MEKIKLKRSEIVALGQAITDFEGREEPVKDENGKVLGKWTKPYELDSQHAHKVIYAMARTKKNFESVIECITKTRNTASVNAFKDGKKDEEKKGTLQAEIAMADAEFMEGIEEVEIHKFNILWIKIGENKISPDLITALLPMMIVPDDFGT